MKDYLSEENIDLEIAMFEKRKSQEILESLKRDEQRRRTYVELKIKLFDSFTEEQKKLYDEIKFSYAEYIVGDKLLLL